MSTRPPVLLIHGFIGTLEVEAFPHPHASPHLLGYGMYRDVPSDAISLHAQVRHLRDFVDTHAGEAVDVVGHSVGGAIAMLFAHAHPDRVRRVVNVEGNFTLEDAFWSASVGRMTQAEADAMLAGFRADPVAWLGRSVPTVTPAMHDIAMCWLDHQPASTLRAMGRSIIEVTGHPDYLADIRRVMERHRVSLVCGARSRNDWHLPGWAASLCGAPHVMEGCGHLMMLEDPRRFVEVIETSLR